jgi:tRNA C32,U32 (ribose-2'-O)-methylase TrmJ
VAVVAFAWFAGGGGPREQAVAIPPPEPLATQAVREELHRALEQGLGHIGFLEGDRAGDTMASIRRILGRALLTEREARLLRGLARRLEGT